MICYEWMHNLFDRSVDPRRRHPENRPGVTVRTTVHLVDIAADAAGLYPVTGAQGCPFPARIEQHISGNDVCAVVCTVNLSPKLDVSNCVAGSHAGYVVGFASNHRNLQRAVRGLSNEGEGFQ